ncbi:hypothetical protein [Spirillospora sp. NBC_01491]|uniref:hypothetical protein n=1 Tax=Spirillospora sp. NBC_01491 TaxID=2976007 RepID=UPI002E31319C|nr:hypothetical protein [Spirillospora sp. NBC_01491]
MTRPPAAGRAAEPDARITAHVFERAFGRPPAGIRRTPGVLTLLGGAPPGTPVSDLAPALTMAVTWGVIVAFGDSDDTGAVIDLYSMNHHADRFTAAPGDLRNAGAPGWAAEPLAAFRARPVPPPARMVVNRELPAEMGLFTGVEARCAVALGLDDLHGPSGGGEPQDAAYTTALHAREAEALLVAPGGGAERVPCDLAASGLRLLIIDPGAPAAPSRTVSRAPVDDTSAERAAQALRAGRIADLGPLLTQAHARGAPALDLALDAARDAGALGGRTIGTCVVALVPMANVPQVRAQVGARLAGAVRRPPRFLTATPVPGAVRRGVTDAG